MTINQLNTLTEEELSIVLYIVNVVSPLSFPKIEFKPENLVWFKHDALVKKLLDTFPSIKPEGHEIFKSLMLKLGVKVDINIVPPPPPPVSGSV